MERLLSLQLKFHLKPWFALDWQHQLNIKKVIEAKPLWIRPQSNLNFKLVDTFDINHIQITAVDFKHEVIGIWAKI